MSKRDKNPLKIAGPPVLNSNSPTVPREGGGNGTFLPRVRVKHSNSGGTKIEKKGSSK